MISWDLYFCSLGGILFNNLVKNFYLFVWNMIILRKHRTVVKPRITSLHEPKTVIKLRKETTYLFRYLIQCLIFGIHPWSASTPSYSAGAIHTLEEISGWRILYIDENWFWYVNGYDSGQCDGRNNYENKNNKKH